jgi:hypothetical protein
MRAFYIVGVLIVVAVLAAAFVVTEDGAPGTVQPAVVQQPQPTATQPQTTTGSSADDAAAKGLRIP